MNTENLTVIARDSGLAQLVAAVPEIEGYAASADLRNFEVEGVMRTDGATSPGCTANSLGATGGKCPSADPCPVHLCGGGVSPCYCTGR